MQLQRVKRDVICSFGTTATTLGGVLSGSTTVLKVIVFAFRGTEAIFNTTQHP